MNKQIACKNCPNSSCYIKLCLPEFEKQIEEEKGMVEYARKSKVIKQGSPVAGIFFVFKGKAKVYSEGKAGKEQIIRFAKDGNIIGHRGYTGGATYSISVTALENSTLCFFRTGFFLDLLKKSPRLTYHLLFFYASEMRQADIRLRKMVEFTIKERVADGILMLYNCFGTLEDGKTLAFTISRIDLAKLVGSVPDVISRILAGLANDNVINLDGKKIIIPDKTALETAAHFSDFEPKIQVEY